MDSKMKQEILVWTDSISPGSHISFMQTLIDKGYHIDLMLPTYYSPCVDLLKQIVFIVSK